MRPPLVVARPALQGDGLVPDDVDLFDVGAVPDRLEQIEVVTARVAGSQLIRHSKYGHGDEQGMIPLEVGFEDLLAAAPMVRSNWEDLGRTVRSTI